MLSDAAWWWQGCDILIKPHLLLRHLPPSQATERQWFGQSNLPELRAEEYPGALSPSLLFLLHKVHSHQI